jgi:hypothetical protein
MVSTRSNGSTKKQAAASKSIQLVFSEQVCLVWFIIDAFTHLTIELGYVYLALTDTAEKSDSFMGEIWRQYARADHRWAVRDPNVISLEILTVFVGLLCVVEIYGILKRSPWRHILQAAICVAELYGGWMTFCPEWVEGSPNLDGSTFALLWIYLVFMNGLWVVVPAVLLWDSWSRITNACSFQANINQRFPCNAPSNNVYYVLVGFLVAYIVLVPAVLSTAGVVPVKSS